MTGLPPLDLDVIEDGARARRRRARRGALQAMAVSATVTVVWAGHVTISGHWGRVGDHLVAAATMVAGGFVAGSTPQGGGAVAFPVFTKALDVPAEAARSFSLLIQSVGMSCAAASIVLNRRIVEWRAVATAAPVGIVSFVAVLLLAGEPDRPFWPSTLPGDYVKVTFTIVVAAMAWVVFLGWRTPIRAVSSALPAMNSRLWVALVACGVLGGAASALVGSGADVFVYLFVVVLFGVRAGVGVPTSVVTMAIVSLAGFVVLGLIDGQLSVALDDGAVTAVGGEDLGEPRPLREVDLYGMWLAAVPVVAWGAPLGAWVASRLPVQTLVMLAMGLALLELVSTVVFLDAVRDDAALATYGVVGLAVALGGLTWIAANRRRLFGLPAITLSSLLTRATVEAVDGYDTTFDEDSGGAG